MKVVGQTIIIFGGTGYVGSHLALQFYEKGYRVILAEVIEAYNEENFKGLQELCGDRIELFQLDWRNQKSIFRLIQSFEKVASIIYIGSQLFDGFKTQSIIKPIHQQLDAALSLLTVLEHFSAIPTLLISSYKVYGTSQKSFFKEDFKLLKGKTEELQMNALLEQFFLLLKSKKNVSIARLSLPIGADKSLKIGPLLHCNLGEFHSLILDAILFGKSFPTEFAVIKNEKKYKSIDLIHVSDAAEAIWLIAEKGIINNKPSANIYNVGSNQPFPVNRVAKALRFFNANRLNVYDVKIDTSEQLTVNLSNIKMIADLGWSMRYSVGEAIETHVAYLKKNIGSVKRAA